MSEETYTMPEPEGSTRREYVCLGRDFVAASLEKLERRPAVSDGAQYRYTEEFVKQINPD